MTTQRRSPRDGAIAEARRVQPATILRLVVTLALMLVTAVVLPQLRADAGVLAPTATVTQPDQRVTVKHNIRVAWTITPGGAPVANADVRVRFAPVDGSFGPFTTWQSATTATSGIYRGDLAGAYCFAARGRDTNGLTGPWSPQVCTIVPLDGTEMDGALDSWDNSSCTTCYNATVTQTLTKGTQMSKKHITTKRIAFAAFTCPTCGSFYVMLGKHGMGKVDLKSTTEGVQLITLQTWAKPQSGNLSLKVTSSNKRVFIDAVALGRL